MPRSRINGGCKPRARVLTCICIVCKEPFPATRHDAHFCGDAHRMKHHRVQKVLRENRSTAIVDPCVELGNFYDRQAAAAKRKDNAFGRSNC
jgi:hypothetical protein